jgi:hypothetical protein
VYGTDKTFNFRDIADVKSRIRMNVTKKYFEDEAIKRKQQEEEETGVCKKDKPKKRPDLKRKKSFTECQMKFEDGLEMKE